MTIEAMGNAPGWASAFAIVVSTITAFIRKAGPELRKWSRCFGRAKVAECNNDITEDAPYLRSISTRPPTQGEDLGHDRQPTGAMCRVKSVTQIRFNAWHYSDSSLWASLAIEIFERLADPEPIDPSVHDQWLRRLGDPKQPERESLLGQLETYRAAKAVLDAQRDGLVAQRAAVEQRRATAAQRRRDAIADVQLVDVMGEVINDPAVQKSLDEIGAELEVKPAVAELRSLSTELRSTSGYLQAVWRRIEPKWLAVLLSSVGAVLLIASGALLIHGDLVGPIVAAIGAVAAASTAIAGPARSAAKHVNSSLAAVSAALSAAEKAEARARVDRSRAERQLDQSLAEIDREIAEATAAAADLTQRIAATEAEADSLSVGRQLYDFLADRAAGTRSMSGSSACSTETSGSSTPSSERSQRPLPRSAHPRVSSPRSTASSCT